MEDILKKFLFLSLIVIILFFPVMNFYYDYKFNKFYSSRDLSEARHNYDVAARDKGIKFLSSEAERANLILLGSSELKYDYDQRIDKMLPNSQANYEVTFSGRSLVQSMHQAALMGSLKNLDGNSKIAFIVSSQWFSEPNGVSQRGYQYNFTPIQFYSFMRNNRISKEDKQYYARRNTQLLKDDNRYSDEYFYSILNAQDNIKNSVLKTIFAPYFEFKYQLLVIRDKKKIADMIEGTKLAAEKELPVINWNEEYEKAEEQAKNVVSDNFLRIDNDYFKKHILETMSKAKNLKKNEKQLESVETEDFKFFIRVAKSLGVKPTIVFQPVTGKYYDYMGLTKNKRRMFIDALSDYAKDADANIIDLTDFDYELYYMRDIIHLGWKGWLEFDKQIFDIYKDK